MNAQTILSTASLPALCLSALILAGCAPEPAPTPELPPEDTDACGASDRQEFVGKPVSEALLPFGTLLRVIGPNEAVTQDFRPERLNVQVDTVGKIERIWCG